MGVTVTLVLSTTSGFFCTFPGSRGLERPPCTAPGQWCQGKGSSRACWTPLGPAVLVGTAGPKIKLTAWQRTQQLFDGVLICSQSLV